jgi:hypothetical protein
MLTTVFFFVLHALTWVLAVILSLGAFLRAILVTFLVWFFYDSISFGVAYYTPYTVPEFSFKACFWLFYLLAVAGSVVRTSVSINTKDKKD